MAEQIKVAILEERLQNFEAIVTKLDSAIEKLAEVYRNPAAHSEIFGDNALLEVRKAVFKLINLVLKKAV